MRTSAVQSCSLMGIFAQYFLVAVRAYRHLSIVNFLWAVEPQHMAKKHSSFYMLSRIEASLNKSLLSSTFPSSSPSKCKKIRTKKEKVWSSSQAAKLEIIHIQKVQSCRRLPIKRTLYHLTVASHRISTSSAPHNPIWHSKLTQGKFKSSTGKISHIPEPTVSLPIPLWRPLLPFQSLFRLGSQLANEIQTSTPNIMVLTAEPSSPPLEPKTNARDSQRSTLTLCRSIGEPLGCDALPDSLGRVLSELIRISQSNASILYNSDMSHNIPFVHKAATPHCSCFPPSSITSPFPTSNLFI